MDNQNNTPLVDAILNKDISVVDKAIRDVLHKEYSSVVKVD